MSETLLAKNREKIMIKMWEITHKKYFLAHSGRFGKKLRIYFHK
jgi:hypothetical protein